MRITCLIDSLSSGGAQRQLCSLAALLTQRGHEVLMLTYYPLTPPFDFFLPLLRQAGVECRSVYHASKLKRILNVRRALRGGQQDVALAFLNASSLYAELAALPSRKWGLVVSERSLVSKTRSTRLGILFHRIADYLTTNSYTNRLLIENLVPSLAGRVVTIYNAVDLEHFCPAPAPSRRSDGTIKLVVAANYQALKNPERLVEAMVRVRDRAPELSLTLDWYGGSPRNQKTGAPVTTVYDAAARLILEQRLQSSVRLHEASPAIADVYRGADAVILPSLFEGLSNTICEAMACGRPVLMSEVSDARRIVKNRENGFLFDPTSAEDIARAILDFARLSPTEREALGRCGRLMAEEMFNPNRFVEQYLEVLTAAAFRKKVTTRTETPVRVSQDS
ncbi:MAG TPA: glycosyltransferase family 4 protein [Armatimonadota bacterium]|nr:glycosyltransferase family 4 protein [Armatimonadota bacterium]